MEQTGMEWGRRGGDRRRPRAGRDSWVSNDRLESTKTDDVVALNAE
jgi:hypothetical protein